MSQQPRDRNGLGSILLDESASLAFVNAQVGKLRLLSQHLSIDTIDLENSDVYVTLVRMKDGKKYTIRLRCDGYPLTAPSVVFVNPADRRSEGGQFWPDDGNRAFKRSENPPFICVRGIREYHQRHGGEQFTQADVSLPGIVAMLVTMMNV